LRWIPIADEARPTAGPSQRTQPRERIESERSRAATLSSIAVSLSRRDQMAAANEKDGPAGAGNRIMPNSRSVEAERRHAPVGRSFRRSARTPVTASANKRDAAA